MSPTSSRIGYTTTTYRVQQFVVHYTEAYTSTRAQNDSGPKPLLRNRPTRYYSLSTLAAFGGITGHRPTDISFTTNGFRKRSTEHVAYKVGYRAT